MAFKCIITLTGSLKIPHQKELTMKFIIAGFGSIGRRHLRNLRELGQTDLVLLRSGRSTLPDDEVRELPVVTTIEEALALKPDGIVIANPTALHLPLAIPALEAGAAVMMEKPITGDPAEAAAAAETLKAGHGRFLMGFQYRFHPGLLEVKRRIERVEIGRVLSYRVTWGEYLPGWHPWEDYRQSYAARADLGGGVLATLCHPLDYCTWLFGDTARIWGYNGKISDLELNVDDVAEIGLVHGSGVIGSIHLDYYRRVGRNDAEFVGTEGILRWRNDDGQVCLIKPNEETEIWFPPEGFERNWLFLDEMRHFIEVASGKADPSCTVDDGLRSMQMIDAVRRSMAEGRFVQL